MAEPRADQRESEQGPGEEDLFLQRLQSLGWRGELRRGEPLWKHTSFRIGGPARLFLVAEGRDDLRLFSRLGQERGAAGWFVLGAGTNVLISDAGVEEPVLKLGQAFRTLERRRSAVRAGGALPLPRLARVASEWGLSGLEWAAGIPGSVGGAVAMNAGAFGGQMADVVKSVAVLDLTSGREEEWPAERLNFGYRTTALQGADKVVTAAYLELRPAQRREAVRERMEELLRRRREKQPLGLPSAGSVFRNPPGDAAGRLIEAAGCKGMRRGDAQVSPHHANFIVNLGQARASDVWALIQEVSRRVRERFGVELALELKLVGDFPPGEGEGCA
ncbi:MAG: UDP-N-acetylmuramate dehydrogenase [Bacillota bacterium]|nr:UDP-N-acetylmuramate dehydrogenase [Bacillota bacterium]